MMIRKYPAGNDHDYCTADLHIVLAGNLPFLDKINIKVSTTNNSLYNAQFTR